MKTFRIILPVLFLVTALSAAAYAYTDEVNGASWAMQMYRPNYFLFDIFNRAATSKLELSFKIAMVDNSNFYFAYTQLMFWQLWVDSQPFYDLNYNPEFFYRFHFASDKKAGLDIGLIEHESNGVAGPDSRGWNRSYLRFFQEWNFGAGYKFYFNVKAWVPYLLDSNNMDIAKYRGLYEIYLTLEDFMKLFGWFDRSDLTLRFYPGGKYYIDPFEGGMEITWRFKTKLFESTLPMFNFQFFLGHAECLKDYNVQTMKFRLGIGF